MVLNMWLIRCYLTSLEILTISFQIGHRKIHENSNDNALDNRHIFLLN